MKRRVDARGQDRDGRRGEVFSVRVTAEERAALEAARAAGGGPRHLGPWLVWNALERHRGAPAPAVVVPGPGTTAALPLAGLEPTSSGTTATGTVVPARERRILDLCGGTGAWSEPYRAAGYPVTVVTLPDGDVRTWRPPDRGPWWGVLCAPPCDQFSLARNGHPELPRDLRAGLEVVGACLRIVHALKPRWWALENPTGLLCNFLGTPRDVWEPCDFGDPWTKRTALWGEFALPRRGPYVVPTGSALDRSSAAARAITPPGFARAFFEANP